MFHILYLKKFITNHLVYESLMIMKIIQSEDAQLCHVANDPRVSVSLSLTFMPTAGRPQPRSAPSASPPKATEAASLERLQSWSRGQTDRQTHKLDSKAAFQGTHITSHDLLAGAGHTAKPDG